MRFLISDQKQISHRFRGMASFLSYPLHLTPNLTVFPLLYIPQILYAESLDNWLITV